MHLRYIQREGVSRAGERGELYGPDTDQADAKAFEERLREDRHQFRFIVSPEDATELEDLKPFTRSLMAQVQRDLATKLEWVAVDHWDTDNPHTHILLRGRDETGQDLIIAGDYIAHGMRARAAEIATEWLGPRTDLEIRQSLAREVSQERWTSLDRMISKKIDQGVIDLRESGLTAEGQRHRALLIGRLDHLTQMGLAQKTSRGVWAVSPDSEQTLVRMGERADIIRTMQRALPGERREYALFDATGTAAPVTGRIVAKGLSDELHERGYLIVDGLDGRAHYALMAPKVDLTDLSVGAIVTVRRGSEGRAADRTIASLSEGGIYRTADHLERARVSADGRYDPAEFVQAHVRRLEALRRAGIVERLEEGVWRVPSDLMKRGRAYDREQTRGAVVDVRSYVPLARQTRVIGATWLDQQIEGDRAGLGLRGFGAEARTALEQREAFLIEQGLAQRQGGRTILARNLYAVLRARELETAAGALAKETGLEYQPAVDGDRISGTYRRNVTLASGRFAMLENSLGFALVPWRPVIEPRRGQSVTALVRGNGVSWEFGRQRGLLR